MGSFASIAEFRQLTQNIATENVKQGFTVL